MLTACFGAWELGPQHGFARISKWNCSKSPTTVSQNLILLTFIIMSYVQGLDGDVSATFTLADTEATRTMWNGNKYILHIHMVYTNKIILVS